MNLNQDPKRPRWIARTSRRDFLSSVALTTGSIAASPLLLRAGESPATVLRAGVMGLGRGMAHIDALLAQPNVQVAWVCDVDERRLSAGKQRVEQRQPGHAVRATNDVRRVLDDPEVDLLTIAAPNHWHAPATILACNAGKHVYVEKPGSHNLREAEWMVTAAQRHQRIVQLGTQRRSWPAIREMIARLHEGVIGRVTFARCWYSNARPSIGRGQPVPIPDSLDYDLWQGPAPERPYLDNLVHYNWHWRWHWGGGEMANNGVHALDLACWGLRAEHPHRVTYNGGRYHYVDDQQTPDTAVAVFNFDSVGVAWDGSSCVPRREEDLPFVAFYGEGGSVVNRGGGYTVYDDKGAEAERHTGPGGDGGHFRNFVDAIRGGAPLNAEIAEGQKAARLCHLGNIAYRTESEVSTDPKTGRILNHLETMKYQQRAYRQGWKPDVG